MLHIRSWNGTWYIIPFPFTILLSYADQICKSHILHIRLLIIYLNLIIYFYCVFERQRDKKGNTQRDRCSLRCSLLRYLQEADTPVTIRTRDSTSKPQSSMSAAGTQELKPPSATCQGIHSKKLTLQWRRWDLNQELQHGRWVSHVVT